MRKVTFISREHGDHGEVYDADGNLVKGCYSAYLETGLCLVVGDNGKRSLEQFKAPLSFVAKRVQFTNPTRWSEVIGRENSFPSNRTVKELIKQGQQLECRCRRCLDENQVDCWWMIVCQKCGNKRCPHATDHRLECTNSNEPGQEGSVY